MKTSLIYSELKYIWTEKKKKKTMTTKQRLAAHLNGLMPRGQTCPAKDLQSPRRSLSSPAGAARLVELHSCATVRAVGTGRAQQGAARTCASWAVPHRRRCQQVRALLPPGMDVPIFAGTGVNPSAVRCDALMASLTSGTAQRSREERSVALLDSTLPVMGPAMAFGLQESGTAVTQLLFHQQFLPLAPEPFRGMG